MATLTAREIQEFVENGFVKIDDAFSRDLAGECRRILWQKLGLDPNDPADWQEPVIRLADYERQPFDQIVNTPRLHSAFDQLVGKGRWRPRADTGTFVIRFPCKGAPSDTGWHIDSSFPDEDSTTNDYTTWRVNLRSRGRALLMLFLFSDVGPEDAPTRVRVGSHLMVPPLLEPFAEKGLSSTEVPSTGLVNATAGLPVVLATGLAGTVYLCHPFLVHAAQAIQGNTPRFLSQPELPPAQPYQLQRPDLDYSPVELGIRRALKRH